jgi:predicted small metal-binding protein
VPFQFGNIDDRCREDHSMLRELRCSDLMPGCNFVVRGNDDSEVMRKTAEHVRSVHKMVAIAMDVERKARAAIRDAGGGQPVAL